MTLGGALGWSCFGFVELVPLNFCLVWPLAVASILGRYLEMRSVVKPVHDVKALCLINWMNMLLDGLKQSA